jgi:nitroreductase
MHPISSEQLLRQLKWRYATKQFDLSKKIPGDLWDALEETLVLTPSSFGLQPWKFIVVSDPAVREKLKAASWNQGQVTDASHLVVFAVCTENTEPYVESYIQSIAQTRQQPADSPSLAGLKKMILDYSKTRPNFDWNARQAYIAIGSFMTSAALLGIDTCPLEGLDPQQYDEILGLRQKGLATVVACVAGYRASSDKYASLAKVRFPKDQLFIRA